MGEYLCVWENAHLFMKRSLSCMLWGKAAALITQRKSIVPSISLLLFHSRSLVFFLSLLCFLSFLNHKKRLLQRKIRCSPYCTLLTQSNWQKGEEKPKTKRPKSNKTAAPEKSRRESAISIYHNQQQKLMGPQKQNAAEQTQTTLFLFTGRQNAFTIKISQSK